MRGAVVAALMLAGCAAQQSPASQAGLDHLFNPNDYTGAGDACGASAFAHLVGEPWGETHQAALPADARVIRHDMANTLDFAPGRINVILADDERIAVIGCF
ncbi:MAG: I78 family peptidase inhibitor [Hyphomonadaceae bacterium]